MFKLKETTIEKGRKLIAFLLIAVITVLTVSVIGVKIDPRKIVSSSSTEKKLSSILSSVEGVGETKVMIKYDNSENIEGVMVTCIGGGNPLIKEKVVYGVASTLDISKEKVTVFQMKKGD